MKIEKLKLTDQEQKKLDRLLTNVNKSRSPDPAKDRLKEKHLIFFYGTCKKCGVHATTISITKIHGAKLAERYCDEHSNTKARSKK